MISLTLPNYTYNKKTWLQNKEEDCNLETAKKQFIYRQ